MTLVYFVLAAVADLFVYGQLQHLPQGPPAGGNSRQQTRGRKCRSGSRDVMTGTAPPREVGRAEPRRLLELVGEAAGDRAPQRRSVRAPKLGVKGAVVLLFQPTSVHRRSALGSIA